jgi:hypothetical protein
MVAQTKTWDDSPERPALDARGLCASRAGAEPRQRPLGVFMVLYGYFAAQRGPGPNPATAGGCALRTCVRADRATSAFTADVYTSVGEELAESAASAIAAYVPRRSRMSQQ